MILDGNKIKIIIPYLGSLLILFGYLKLSLFYNHFNINISEYIEITEVITGFLPDILKYSIIIICAFIYNFIITTEEENNSEHNNKIDIINTPEFFKRLKKHFKYNPLQYIIPVFLFLLAIASYFFNPKVFLTFKLGTIIFFINLLHTIFSFEFYRKYKLIYKKSIDSTYYNLQIIFFLFLLFNIPSIYMKIDDTTNRKSSEVCFKHLENLIQSENDYLYLGQTKNYLFMYDNINKESIVFPRNEITEFRIRESNNIQGK